MTKHDDKHGKPEHGQVMKHGAPTLVPSHRAEVRVVSGVSMPGLMGPQSTSHYGECSCEWRGPVRPDGNTAGRDVEAHLTDPAL